MLYVGGVGRLVEEVGEARWSVTKGKDDRKLLEGLKR